MTLKEISIKYNIQTDTLIRRAGRLKFIRVNGKYTEEQVKLISHPVNLSLKTILLIYEFKERYPSLSPVMIADMFNINQLKVVDLFLKDFIIVPSKMN
jgi:hypothetical protein